MKTPIKTPISTPKQYRINSYYLQLRFKGYSEIAARAIAGRMIQKKKPINAYLAESARGVEEINAYYRVWGDE